MVATGRQQARDRQRLVYVTRFASHQAGVWQLRGRGVGGWRDPGLAARAVQEPRPEAAAEPRAQGVLPSRARSRGPTASREQRGAEPAARAGLIQKDAAAKFDFRISLHEASEIIKRKKVWKKVYNVIARMIAENERYRFRLRCQKSSNEDSN